MNTLLLDIGNVIMHFDFAPAGTRLAAASAAAGDPIELLTPLKRKLEIGEIDGPVFVDRAIAELGFRGGPDAFRRTWEDIFSPNLPMWETIRRAESRYRLFLISDTSDIHKESLFRQYEIFASFDGGVYSYETGCMKPDPGIYRTAIEGLGLEPGETFYVDDRPANVDAGRRAGFVSHHYHPGRHDRFLGEARAHGLDL